ncbi:tetratricopeptide repeat protein 30A [Trichuris trichiura]|uniref:Tetratricopeptide repeat protein 30 n=1 Tax=Trichuris trichiura TaxID=36087 RepID=A0A077ZKW6_TRITR|nr:tetratricopeptide repeat protein 30A [Trichuris trichiura]
MHYTETAKNTRNVYTLIRNGQFNEAAQLLNRQLNVDHAVTTCIIPQSFLKSFTFQNRAALSLLGYCCVQLHNFIGASRCYSHLVLSYPHSERYRQAILFLLYKLMLSMVTAMCYYKIHMFDDAAKACGHLAIPDLNSDMHKLMAAIKYDINDLPSSKAYLSQCSNDDKDNEMNWGCICFKEENFETALQHFITTAKRGGRTLDLLYDLAVCYYKLKQYSQAMRYIEEICERHAAEFLQPDTRFSAEGTEVHYAGNKGMLQQSVLIEAFNLKAAIEFKLKNCISPWKSHSMHSVLYLNAAQAIANMPPREATRLDAITLHNEALVKMANEPMEGFAKLQFLCGQTRFPPEALVNLLFVCCKYGVGSQMLITSTGACCHVIHLFWLPFNQGHVYVKQVERYDSKSVLPPLTLELRILKYEHDFIAAIIMQPQSPEESLSKIETLVEQQGDILQRLEEQLSAAQQANDEDVRSKIAETYNEALQLYLPVLMEQAKMYWDKKNYRQVEKIFQHSADFCGNYDSWKLNVGHTLFMQQTKYKEAAGFYETLTLDSSAIVLANLCVCYILMNQNEAAEELMRKVEKEEDKLLLTDPDQRLFHLCIINLVIGYENGILCSLPKFLSLARLDFIYTLNAIVCALKEQSLTTECV